MSETTFTGRMKIISECAGVLDNALTNMGSTLDSYPTAQAALDALIAWEIQVATDPRVNGGKKLVDAGAVVLSVARAENLDSVLTTFRVGVRLEQGFDAHNKLRIAIEQAKEKNGN
jgi:hypothetical protein